MTLTTHAMEWLGQNRERSYPMARDGWRKKVSASSGLDCVILDALAFCNGAKGDESLSIERISVSNDATRIDMKYAGHGFSVTLRGGEDSGEGSYERIRCSMPSQGGQKASISLCFSSHRYIVGHVGSGEWTIGCQVLPSRVVSLADGHGVGGILANGSQGIEGHEGSAVAHGDVVLEDGYRTSPIILRGRVLVRVGKTFGLDPCKYDYGEGGTTDCRKPLFFFCGQNAINSGNIVLKGGMGIGVGQGRTYKVRTGTCAGKTVPCIEITAGRELLDLYIPQDSES